jgi:outer membrane protein assembly factor BamB
MKRYRHDEVINSPPVHGYTVYHLPTLDPSLHRLLPLFLALLSLAAADWPQMGGPLGRHAAEEAALPAGWTGAGARVAWRVPLTNPGNPGQVAAAGGEVFLIDQNQAADQAILRVLALADGRELWRISWPTPAGEWNEVKRPRGMPAVTVEHVYVVGPPPPNAREEDGRDPPVPLRAVDRTTHQDAWLFDPATVNVQVNKCASPCVEGALVLVSGKGKSGDVLLAVDRRSGRHAWTCELPFVNGFHGRLMNAPQVAAFDGVRQIVVHHDSGVSGVSPDGKLLWNWDGYRRGTLTATPTVAPDGHIYVSSGHEGSCALFRVTRRDGQWTCTTVFVDGETGRHSVSAAGRMPHLIDGNKNITSAAWHDGCFFAVGQKGLHCLKSDGSIAWTGNQKPPNISTSTVVLSANVLTYLSGDLLIARASPDRFQELARVKVGPHATSSQLAGADGRVLIRCDGDAKEGGKGGELVCVDLRNM